MKKIMEVNGEVYVRVSFLVDYGMNRASVHNALKKFRDKKSERYEYFMDPVDKRIRWIKYLSIPLSARLRKNLPLVEDLVANYEKINKSKITELIRTSFDLMITTGYKQFTTCYWGIISDQYTVV
jgi:hypothetical protein